MTELDRTQDPRPATDGVSRRAMLRGATVGGVALPLLAACGGGSGSDSSGGSSESSSGAGGSSGGSSAVQVAASEVPVGGGTILKEQKVVVTQPTKGEYKAFTAVCTHQGCTVGEVSGGEIICPCHGSHFSIKDGSATSGPAQAPLAEKKVSEKGSKLSVT